MAAVYLEKLAFNRINYLSQREAIVAENVANANTPGFRAREIQPFDQILAAKGTNGSSADVEELWSGEFIRNATTEEAATDDSDTLSGNSVNVEKQMSALSDINKGVALATNVTRVFNQMFSAVAK